VADTLFTIPVARNVWLRRDWNDTMMKRIVDSKLGQHGKYVYSDNDFILLGKIVEAVTGLTLDHFLQKTFYGPMGLATTGFSRGSVLYPMALSHRKRKIFSPAVAAWLCT
jgi:CubicO group peptidase (beta-lactamase class C family)